MSQNWIVYPDITNEKGQPLMWPNGFIPVPQSREVAFLLMQYHQDTGNDISLDEVSQIALHVAKKCFDACQKETSEEIKTGYLTEGLHALQIVAFSRKPNEELGDGLRDMARRHTIESL